MRVIIGKDKLGCTTNRNRLGADTCCSPAFIGNKMLAACIEARQTAVIHNGHLDGVVALGNPIFSVYIKKHLTIESCKALTLASTCQNKILRA